MNTSPREAIAQALARSFVSRFPGVAGVIRTPPDPVITVVPPNPALGSVTVWVDDYGSEVTVDFGLFTHTHFIAGNPVTTPQDAQNLARGAVDLLDALFSDRVLLWRSKERSGFEELEPNAALSDLTHIPADAIAHLWSRPWSSVTHTD